MRLIDVDRKPKVKYYVWAVPIGDNHFPGATIPDYIVNNKYFDTIEEAKKLKDECDNNGRWENYYINKKVEKFEDYPTVDAIPIEWIKNWFNPKYANTVYYSLLRDMIKDWEKENEMR